MVKNLTPARSFVVFTSAFARKVFNAIFFFQNEIFSELIIPNIFADYLLVKMYFVRALTL